MTVKSRTASLPQSEFTSFIKHVKENRYNSRCHFIELFLGSYTFVLVLLSPFCLSPLDFIVRESSSSSSQIPTSASFPVMTPRDSTPLPCPLSRSVPAVTERSETLTVL